MGPGHPHRVTREFLRERARDTPKFWLAGASLGALAVGGAILTLGLVQRWGEVFPRWIPVLGGKPVPPRTAIIPASLVAVLVTSAGLEHYRAALLGDFPVGTGANWGDRGAQVPLAAVGRRSGCGDLRLLPPPARPVPALPITAPRPVGGSA